MPSRQSAVIVLLFACCFLIPRPAQARGAGTDYFLLSPDGKLLWQHRWDRADHVDYQAELVYRLRDGQLTATPFGKREPLWSVPSPLREGDFRAWYSAAWQSGPGIVVLISPDAIHGLDSKTGEKKYSFAIAKYETLRLRNYLQPGSPLRSEGEPRSERYRYLVTRTQPAGIARFDLWQGKLTWERELPAMDGGRTEVGACVPGVVEFSLGEGRFRHLFFDETTGAPLTKLPTAADQALQIVRGDGVLFHLSKDRAPTLTAFDTGRQKALWSIADLAGVDRFIGDHQHDRLLCAAARDLLVIDTRQKRVVSRIAVSGPSTFSIAATKSALLMEDQGELRSIEPATGKTLWKVEAFVKPGSAVSFCVPDPEAKEQDRFLVVKPPVEKNERVLGVVEARSLKDGSAAWSWPVPYVFGDSTSIHVQACRSGYLVQRHWLVLD
jgi:hypothetical protein